MHLFFYTCVIPQRRKVVQLSDLLMAALQEDAVTLSVKDTSLALSALADMIKSRQALDDNSGGFVNLLLCGFDVV